MVAGPGLRGGTVHHDHLGVAAQLPKVVPEPVLAVAGIGAQGQDVAQSEAHRWSPWSGARSEVSRRSQAARRWRAIRSSSPWQAAAPDPMFAASDGSGGS